VVEHSGYVARPDYRVDVLARRNRVTVLEGTARFIGDHKVGY